ncbi:AMP-binding protein [Nocardia flavorosea]|uniref:AMP-binding protein n=1 Tax=Nocardia flavorosea TaxID=53429 RepID=UPI00245588FC|nr:AMP-binding protein [Nocardia flavorosea]
MRYQGTGSDHPLSAAQLRWWVAQQLYPGIPNTVAMYLDLRGPVEVELMRECGRRAARELESPGIRVREVDGRPRQLLADTDLPFFVCDLADHTDPIIAALDRMADDHFAPLDPRTDDLTVATLYRVAADRHLLYLRSHHLVLDGAGAVALLRRTGELYRAAVTDTEAGEPGALDTAGLLAAEETYRKSARAAADKEYWLSALSGLSEPVGLAGHPAGPRPRPHRALAGLGPATADAIAAAREQYGASFGELLIAAFACYFAQLTGNDDPVITLPVPARTTAVLRRSAGSVSNVVPLRLTGLTRGTVGVAVAAVRTKIVAALRHQRYPYEEIQHDRGRGRVERGGFGPVVNVLGFVEPLRLGPLTGQAQLLSLGPVEDLLVNGYQLGPDESSISIDFQGNPARYSAAALSWYHHGFLFYLHHFLTAAPDDPVACLGEREKAPDVPGFVPRQAADPRDSPAPIAAVRLLPELLRMGMRPDAVAVSEGTRSLTYRRLDELSRGWAQELIDRGAGPGTPVAVVIPRSIESVLALWAVATAGACFVPIDPADPPDRISSVLAAAGIGFGLTVAAVRPGLSAADATRAATAGPGSGEPVRWLELDGPAATAVQPRQPSGDSIDAGTAERPAAGSRRDTVAPGVEPGEPDTGPAPDGQRVVNRDDTWTEGALHRAGNDNNAVEVGSVHSGRKPEGSADGRKTGTAHGGRGISARTGAVPAGSRNGAGAGTRNGLVGSVQVGERTRAQRVAARVGDGDGPWRYSAAIGGDRKPWAGLCPDHPAYLIHTSGTTGTPKGVLVGHRGLGPLTDYLVERYRVDAESVVLHAHSPVFDAHLLELLAAFAVGARLVVAPAGPVAGTRLTELIRTAEITHLLSTPVVLNSLDPARLPSLRVVVTGGESPGSELVRRWAPRVRLYNGYGPTETTVMTMQSEPLSPAGPVLIGPALPDVRAVQLTPRLRPVPVGGRSELYLGGPGVALGYLHDPATTAVRFVADPAGTGQRLYRTGDLVRADPGGFEYLGRADRQLGLHGRRIEPGEIESALTAGPEIAQAVVTVTGESGPAACLAAYVVVAAGHGFDPVATLSRIRTVLPSALVPAVLLEIDRIPLTPNGKTDRDRLPEPVLSRAYRAPETDVQRLVARQVGGVVGRPDIGLDDDFFALGGNSLLGVALSAELAEVTGVPVTVRWLYTAPTVAELADRIADYRHSGTPADSDEEGSDHASGEPADSVSPARRFAATGGNGTGGAEGLQIILPLRRNGSRPPLFCFHSAVPLAWCYAGLSHRIAARPVYGVQSPVLTSPDSEVATADTLAGRYLREILRVQPDGPYHLLGWSLGGQLAHAVAVRLRDLGHEVAMLAMLDSVVFPPDAPPPPRPRMRDLLTHLLGDEPDAHAAAQAPELTAAEAAAELAAAGATLGAGLTAGQLDRLHRAYIAGVEISARYRPGVFDGDLLYFSATRGMTEMLDVQMWRPFVTGELLEYPVDTEHGRLMNPESVAVIAPVLDRYPAELTARADSR